MSIAMDGNTSNRIERSSFLHGMSRVSTYESPDPGSSVGGIFDRDRRFSAASLPAPMSRNAVREAEQDLDSCSSSSIGRNSDSSGRASDEDTDSGDAEVQSSYRGPLGAMDALEEALPIRRGISNFYYGKSKSFTSLADATSCSSIKDIAKPENAYDRKRKNLLAHCSFWDQNCNHLSTSKQSNSGITSKKPANSSRGTLAQVVATSSSESNDTSGRAVSNSSSPAICLPPRHPRIKKTSKNESLSSPPQRNLSPWRSLSLSDLQCAEAATTGVRCLGPIDKPYGHPI